MSELTPLQKLDDAIHEYFAALEQEGTISGWTLAFQSQTLNSNSDLLPLSFASDFTMGPSTSPETAMGLAHLTRARLEQALVFGGDDE